MKIVITGGAGFIGTNAAGHYLARGHEVTVFDNLARPGSEVNLAWLQGLDAPRLRFVRGDVREPASLERALDPGTDVVIHLAGQVAVTSSVQNPRADFEHNALGTLNVLEAVRAQCPAAIVLYASTNKVYGGLDHLPIEEHETRYGYRPPVRGVAEDCPLDFHSPYGCSKGCGDQYMRDYHRIFGLRTVVFRQSCIYGEHQYGHEDQGWVAHLCRSVWRNEPITIFGNGKQVRDLLWIGDLLAAYDAALGAIDDVAGGIFNLGGGPENTISVWKEFSAVLERLAGRPVSAAYGGWRPGDQLIYVSELARAERLLGWKPRIGVEEGLRRLWDWIVENIG